MKAFQTLLFLAVIILIGGMAALYWGNSVQEATVPTEVVEETPEPTEEELSPGSYLVFQSVTTTDAGTQDWANDDTDTYTFYRLALGEATYRANPAVSDLVEIVSVEHGPDFSGSLTTNILGQNLLMHRYESTREFDDESGRPTDGEERDALFSLEGELLEVRPEQWGILRSSNNLYEVTWQTLYDENASDIVVTNRETGVQTTVSTELIEDTDTRWQIEPYLIDNTGAYLYVREVCGCEARLSGLWQVDLATFEVRRLDDLVDFDSWGMVDINSDTPRMIALDTVRESSDEGPFDELLPPSTVRILGLNGDYAVTELLNDGTRAWDWPILDPEGRDQYLLRLWSDENLTYLLDFETREVTEEQLLTSGGWVLDWVGDWLVVQDINTQEVKLVNIETKDEVVIELPGERPRYVGSIELE